MKWLKYFTVINNIGYQQTLKKIFLKYKRNVYPRDAFPLRSNNSIHDVVDDQIEILLH